MSKKDYINKNIHRSAIEKLSESEKKFYTLFNSSPTAIVLSTLKDGRFAEFNDEFLKLTGYTREELLGLTSFEAGIVSDPKSREATLRSLQKNEKVDPFEVTITQKSGGLRFGIVTLEIVSIDGENYALSNFMDITERKLAAMEVVQLNRLYATLSQINQAIVRIEDPNELYQVACDICMNYGEFSLAWIGLFEHKTEGSTYSICNYNPFDTNNPELQCILPACQPLIDKAKKECRTVLSDGPNDNQQIEGACEFVSHAVVPFTTNGVIAGFLSLHSKGKRIFTSQMIKLLDEISGDISFALDQMHMNSEHKVMEAKLKASEERYRLISENAHDWIYLISPEKEMLYVSPSCERVTGYSAEEFENDKNLMVKIVHPEDRDLLLNHLTEDNINENHRIEFRVITKSNDICWISHTCSPVFTDDNIYAGRRGSNRNITDIKTKEFALRESEERLATVFNASPDAVLIFDKNGNIIETNPALIQILGYSRDELLNMSIMDLSSKVFRNLLKALSQISVKTEQLFKWKLVRKDGKMIPVEVIVKPFMMQGAPCFYCSARDITQRIFAESKIKIQLERLRSLRNIDLMITSNRELLQTVNVIIDYVIKQLKVDACDVLLYDENLQGFKCISSMGLKSETINTRASRQSDDFANRVMKEKQTIHLTHPPGIDLNIDRRNSAVNDSISEYYGVPLISNSVIIGVLEIYKRLPFDADQDWLDYMETLAGQAAVAINDAKMLEDIKRSNEELVEAYDATIEGWSRALDLRDKDTEWHSLRVTEMTVKLASAAGMSEGQIRNVRRGALLHDIGKLGVPDSILLKQDKLSEHEWAVMRKHPQYAYELLSSIEYLKPALTIPYHHHEKWDGTGYPLSLKGEEIPMEARLFSIVDVWDALCSDRPYRPAWAEKDVNDYIKNQSGTHFDPQVVELFLRVFGDARIKESNK